MSLELELAYTTLRQQVERLLQHSAYSVVNLGKLFAGLMVPKTDS